MSSSSRKDVSHDPFAADIFVEHKKNNTPVPEINDDANRNSAAWNKFLPRAAPAPVNWTALKNDLSFEFYDEFPRRLANSLEEFFKLSDKRAIEILFLVQREIDAAENLNGETSWWLEIEIENSRAEIFLEIDEIFAVWLIDAALGEKFSDDAGQVRSLTASERAVLEFLSLNLTHQANLILQSPIFKFRALKSRTPPSLIDFLAAENSSVLVANWQIVHQLMPSIVKIYLTPIALQSLAAPENKLRAAPRFRRSSLRNLEKRIKDLRMRLALGDCELSPAEFGAIEAGDILLLGNNSFIFADGSLSGRAEVFLGDSENIKIGGEIITEDFAGQQPIEEKALSDDNKIPVRQLRSARPLRIMIENFTENELPTISDEIMTEINENLAGENSLETNIEQNNLAIENLVLTLRVELEARRLPLTEIGDLSENQVLELGIRPTDTVNLLIDNKLVGRGELVLVEDRLGVRITKLLR